MSRTFLSSFNPPATYCHPTPSFLPVLFLESIGCFSHIRQQSQAFHATIFSSMVFCGSAVNGPRSAVINKPTGNELASPNVPSLALPNHRVVHLLPKSRNCFMLMFKTINRSFSTTNIYYWAAFCCRKVN